MVNVLVCGAGGRMGKEVVKAVAADKETTLVGAVDISADGQDAGELAGIGRLGVYVYKDLAEALEVSKPDVVVDFTNPRVIFDNAKTTISHGVSIVIGTTGLTEEQRAVLAEMSKEYQANVLVAPNFSLGAVMMMKVSQELVKYFPDVEVIELHHNQKYDAPSGTSILTAKLLAEARDAAAVSEDKTKESLVGARGAKVQEIPVHSVRLPGYVAHQEVLFGGKGEILSIRHDSLSRESFMPGVILACKCIADHPGLTYGLEHYL